MLNFIIINSLDFTSYAEAEIDILSRMSMYLIIILVNHRHVRLIVNLCDMLLSGTVNRDKIEWVGRESIQEQRGRTGLEDVSVQLIRRPETEA